jgi:hypothetical protein
MAYVYDLFGDDWPALKSPGLLLSMIGIDYEH